MKRLALLVIWPVLASADPAAFAVTGWSLDFSNGAAGGTFIIAGPRVAGSGFICTDSPPDPLVPTLGEPVIQIVAADAIDGGFTFSSLVVDGVPLVIPPFGDAQGSTDVFLTEQVTAPGSYPAVGLFGTFAFYGAPPGMAAGNPRGCDVAGVCRELSFVSSGKGFGTVTLTAYPGVPGAFQVSQAVLRFSALAPDTMSLMLLGLLALAARPTLARRQARREPQVQS
jgi:hypothetical protein